MPSIRLFNEINSIQGPPHPGNKQKITCLYGINLKEDNTKVKIKIKIKKIAVLLLLILKNSLKFILLITQSKKNKNYFIAHFKISLVCASTFTVTEFVVGKTHKK